jgi:hypothetical protein
MLILHDPLDHFALFDFQRLSQRCGTDKVILAVLSASLDHLDGGLIAHVLPPEQLTMRGQHIIAVQLVTNTNFFTASG